MQAGAIGTSIWHVPQLNFSLRHSDEFFSRIFDGGAKLAAPKPAPNVIVADYGTILEKHAPVPGCVADVDELPYSKNDIKVAILLTLGLTSDSTLQKHLSNAYVMLAHWQVGVGPKHIGLDVSKLDRTQSVQDLAKQVLASTEGMKKWQPVVDAEMKSLLDDLRTASPGFGNFGRG